MRALLNDRYRTKDGVKSRIGDQRATVLGRQAMKKKSKNAGRAKPLSSAYESQRFPHPSEWLGRWNDGGT